MVIIENIRDGWKKKWIYPEASRLQASQVSVPKTGQEPLNRLRPRPNAELFL